MDRPARIANQTADSWRAQVRSAVIWRSGTQILAQIVQWAATFLVIRILAPADYGLFAMTGVVMTLLDMLNGYGLASAIIQRPAITRREIRQLFGMLLLLNGGLALAQLALAPLAAAYYREPLVAVLLAVQALGYLATPFIALPYALLSRAMDFRAQAAANVAASLGGAATALGGALLGWGVWTLVAAPMAIYAIRAVLLTRAAGSLMWPVFDFRGTRALAGYGGVMALGQLFWFAQSQADVFIAGGALGAHLLGVYTTSRFLVQIFTAKIVPPLNEVAFSAYARIQHDDAAVARAFVRSVRLVMLAAMPFYMGLAATAEPLVLAVLGPHWAEAAPVVRLLALAMPFITINILYSPACEAIGRPGIGVHNGAVGSAIMGVAFLVGIRWGIAGLCWAWILGYPLYLIEGSRRALPVLGVGPRAVAEAAAPPVLAGVAMLLALVALDARLPVLPPLPHLALLVAAGALVYAGWLAVFAGAALREVAALLRRGTPQVA